MRILAKVGGATVQAIDARMNLAMAVGFARAVGHEVVLVHGGGPQVTALGKRLGLEERRVQGLRISDAETAGLVQRVLCGTLGKDLVHALSIAGVPSVSLCGVDGSSFEAIPHKPGGVDLGFVGRLSRVDPALCQTLLDAGYTPVFATSAPFADAPPEAPLFNVNADHAVAPLARALKCDAVLFLTDVAHVRDADGARVGRLDATTVLDLERRGALSGGMRPKVEAALEAAQALPDARVKIAAGQGPNCLLNALSDEAGTHICVAGVTHG